MLVAFYLTVLAADVILNIIGTRGNQPASGSTRAN
jgi:hypothetical protein